MTDFAPGPYAPGPVPPPPGGPTPPRPPRRGLRIALISVAAALLLCVAGAVIIGVTQQHAKPAGSNKAAAQAPLPQDPCGGGVCTTTTPVADSPTTTAVVPLTASDIQVTVKVKKKDCFGSAGCNVEYKIEAGWPDDGQYECEVTYDVHGLEDTQTGTLDIHRDGTYEQDSYQAGETSSSKKKLTAKVTDVDCS